jgi:hypothetical protein
MLKRGPALAVLLVVFAALPALGAEIIAVPDAPAAGAVIGDLQVDVGGVKVAIDRETGRMRSLPTEEARKLQQVILKAFNLNASLVPQTTDSGLTRIELDDRHMNWYMATVGDDGETNFNCVNSLGDVTATILRSMSRPAAPAAQPAPQPDEQRTPTKEEGK